MTKQITTLNELRRGNAYQRAAMLLLDHAFNANHHRQWAIDQSLRLLAGADYETLVATWERVTGIKWDTGIAP